MPPRLDSPVPPALDGEAAVVDQTVMAGTKHQEIPHLVFASGGWWTPHRYLTRWRMHLAAKHLVSGADVSDAARRVGYRSHATFSRTFKSWVGQSPAAYRRAAR